MQLFLDQLVNGVNAGVVYAFIALALVLIFRTTGLLNFAQGEMALFSTFITWRLSESMPIWAAIAVSMLIAMVAGAVIERALIRPVEQKNNPLNTVIVTIGMFLAINAIVQLIWPSTESYTMPKPFGSSTITVGGTDLKASTVGLVAVLVGECVLLWLLLQKTRLGLSIRAVASNQASSRLVGINVGAILLLGWALAAAIGALAGSLVASQDIAFDSSLMQTRLVYAFAAAALGGFDSPLGAVVGGLIVGIADALTVQYIGAVEGIQVVVPLVLIFLVLLVRPNGLFGRTIVERV